MSTPFRNTSGITRTGAELYIQVAYAGQKVGTRPVLWWRVDRGAWHRAAFTYHRPTGGNSPYWDFPQVPIGSFRAHQTRTVEMSFSFYTSSRQGLYFGYTGLGLDSCQRTAGWEQGFSSYTVDYGN